MVMMVFPPMNLSDFLSVAHQHVHVLVCEILSLWISFAIVFLAGQSDNIVPLMSNLHAQASDHCIEVMMVFQPMNLSEFLSGTSTCPCTRVQNLETVDLVCDSILGRTNTY